MKSIPDTFCKNGYTYILKRRDGMIAMYAQLWGKAVQAYEVMRIRRKNPGSLNGVDLTEREILPGDGEWGSMGWTYSANGTGTVAALSRAEAKFEALTGRAHG